MNIIFHFDKFGGGPAAGGSIGEPPRYVAVVRNVDRMKSRPLAIRPVNRSWRFWGMR
jgi:hypothetical protein